jgi:arabinose-5-phosphate isomerase
MNSESIQNLARAVIEIETEAAAVNSLLARIDESFVQACELMLACTGRIVVIGMGKSGHIANKIAATLASTGTPAFFVHPAEASHGDLGMLMPGDIALLLSNSGETDEMNSIIPIFKRMDVKMVAMTGNPESTLAKHATVHINVGIEKEACPLGLAPTSSTTAALVMGDALAVSLLDRRGFTREDFARSHPAGRLGRQLLLLIKDVMHTGDDLPAISDAATISEAIVEMTAKRLGMSAIIDGSNRLLGVLTDGDLRRALDTEVDPHTTLVTEVMTVDPKTISPDSLAMEAVQMMQDFRIQGLLVVDEQQQLAGALNFQDLLQAGVV